MRTPILKGQIQQKVPHLQVLTVAEIRALMASILVRRCLLGLAWGLVLSGTLSIANWPGEWGHSVCGAWGCGPPLQALIACHLSWLVILIPPLFLLSRITDRKLLFLGTLATLSVALSIALTITVHEQLIWKQQVSPWQQQFYWQRVGFVILTTVEVPMIELTSLSMIVLVWIFVGRKKH